MAEPKDTTSFFRKVVKFVANPSTDWAQLGAPSDEARETEFAKGELKAMIERKRRNDFVRKREFDMLRKVRREGLTSEQLAALGGSSRLDDSDGRNPDTGARQETGVKAKIDEIEQQMVGDPYQNPVRRSADYYNAATEPAAMEVIGRNTTTATSRSIAGPLGASLLPAALPDGATAAAALAPAAKAPSLPPVALAPVSAAVMGAGMSPQSSPLLTTAPMAAEPTLAALSILSALPSSASHAALPGEAPSPSAVHSSDVTHDAELDEAVIAFANADFEQCETALLTLTGPLGARAQHPGTWLVLFDLYRAIGQQPKFESLALDYAQRFGWSAPQWYSLPKLVADAAVDEPPRSTRIEGHVGWVCPERVDAEVVARLSSLALQMPLPWVFDWSALQHIDAEACGRLSELFHSWIGQKIEMRWLGGERLFNVLLDAAPVGVRDADPAFWQLRLDALRMTHRPDQFDEAAIDYCVTYEVSPPSWEAAVCEVRISGTGARTTSPPPLSVVGEVSTSFLESHLTEGNGTLQVGSVELAGQLVGDIGDTLKKMDAQLGSASLVNVSCARLIRVDFIAAGDLLNWVLARRSENRSVSFVETHRMVALFFGAMGINEHARVKVRTV